MVVNPFKGISCLKMCDVQLFWVYFLFIVFIQKVVSSLVILVIFFQLTVELHPYLPQPELFKFCNSKGTVDHFDM